MPKGLGCSTRTVADVEAGPVRDHLPKGLKPNAAPGLDAAATICADLVALQRQRVFCIRSQSRINNSVVAFLRVELGYSTRLPKAERDRLSNLALQYKKRIESTLDEDRDPFAVPPPKGLRHVEQAVAIIRNSAASRRPWNDLRQGTEEEMMALAKRLPVYVAFIKPTKGVTALGLAVIVGEAGGDIARFPTRSHFQKRLGLACMDGGVRQGKPGAGATAEDWVRHGYDKHRRAQIWSFLDDVMLRAQWRAAVEDDAGHEIEPGRALGRYGQYYAWKKAEYLTRGHPAPDRAARRYMAKMFLRDLYNAWRQCAA
jgi:hypothetical protein